MAWIAIHQPCPKCGSSDALAIDETGWAKCFANDCKFKVDISTMEIDNTPATPKPLLTGGQYREIKSRGLSVETCQKFGYEIVKQNNQYLFVASYQRNGKVVAQKVRTADKKFWTVGTTQQIELFGQHLWANGGKRLTITEGEPDAMSVSQLQGHKWPVVSISLGASSVVKNMKDNIEFISKFEEVVLMFDNDDAGREAVNKACDVLPVGKVKVATLPLKDANEMLLAGRGEEVIKAIWNAKERTPDDIIDIEDIIDDIKKPIEMGLGWFLDSLTLATYGRRYGEIYCLGAGTGVGKTDFLTQQIAFDVQELNEKVGVIFLESTPAEVGKRIAGKVDQCLYHIPNQYLNTDRLSDTLSNLKGKITFYNAWGQADWSILKNKIRYMVVAKDIKLVYLDHLTALADTADERGSLEKIMKEIAGLANELNCIIHLVSHLATPEGKPHEEGGRVMIRHFKGSRAIGFWSYLMLALERNQQDEDVSQQHTSTLRILKDRYTGQGTGKTFTLRYNQQTGMLSESKGEFRNEGDKKR